MTALFCIRAPDLQKRHYLFCKVLLFRAVLKAKMCLEHWCNDNDMERPKYFVGKRKFLGASLPAVGLTWTGPGSSTGHCSTWPVTNC